ncbi:MAG: hypothetical protein SOY80_02225 [Bacilli bacterium]|nr:hypothetical protein [Bacilli bacterium]
MKEKKQENQPLMFIDTIQEINEKNKLQTYYDSRNKKEKKADS